MRTSARVKIYASVSIHYQAVQSVLELKGAHGSGLGYLAKQIERLILLFRLISP